MKKIYSLVVLLILFFINIIPASAHPLDISVSTGTIQKNIVNFTTYLHSFEVEFLLRNNGIFADGVIDYFKNKPILEKYVKDKVTLKNDNKICTFKDFTIKEEKASKILTEGLATTYKFECDSNIENMSLDMQIFINFPLQTNRITFYNLNNGLKKIKPILYKVLTSKIYGFNVDINNINNAVSKDSDNDGLSDQEEKIYGTDPNKIDTDGDNYTDKEEIDYGWNPLNAELGPWQDYREILNLDEAQKNISNLEQITSEVATKNLSDYGYGNDALKKVMNYIDDFFTNNEGNLLFVYLVIYGLGIIHTVGPGHAKSLLVAYTLEKDHGYKKGIFFAMVFTVTHIMDIVVLFIITKVLTTVIDVSKFSYYTQLGSSILLFILSIYLLYKAFKKRKCCSNKKKEERVKSNLFVAFLAGLAPCSFAWSIFLLLLAIGKSEWIIPLIITLGLGMFTTLVGIVLLAVFVKKHAYKKAEKFGLYSSIISSLVILTISIIMMLRVLKIITLTY